MRMMGIPYSENVRTLRMTRIWCFENDGDFGILAMLWFQF